MRANQATFPVQAMCRVLGLSTSGYYAWLKRPPSDRARRDAELKERIEAVYEENRRVYGRPRARHLLQLSLAMRDEAPIKNGGNALIVGGGSPEKDGVSLGA